MKLKDAFLLGKAITGIDPKIQKKKLPTAKYIPHPYKAVCLISADLEGAWAFTHSQSTKEDPDKPIKLGLQTHKNVPDILNLCDKYKIPITWAAVGHLFLDKCCLVDGKKHADILRIPYFKNEFWEYKQGDWYDSDPGTTLEDDPAWYGANLIDDILSRPIKHEIGCHTFSHIDCTDDKCPKDVFDSEINKCKSLAAEKGFNLTAFVHPGHQIGHLDDIQKHGFTSYRTDFGNVLDLPIERKPGLWEFQNTAEISYCMGQSKAVSTYFFKSLIKKAVKHNRLIVLWFHPSFCPEAIESLIEPIFAYLDENKAQILTTTHSEYVEFLKKIH